MQPDHPSNHPKADRHHRTELYRILGSGPISQTKPADQVGGEEQTCYEPDDNGFVHDNFVPPGSTFRQGTRYEPRFQVEFGKRPQRISHDLPSPGRQHLQAAFSFDAAPPMAVPQRANSALTA
jgi:hypothetical protein